MLVNPTASRPASNFQLGFYRIHRKGKCSGAAIIGMVVLLFETKKFSGCSIGHIMKKITEFFATARKRFGFKRQYDHNYGDAMLNDLSRR